jgi:uncharacterized protein
MSRPPCCRHVAGKPVSAVFKPAGVPACDLEVVTVTLDEFEAIRLADIGGLYQEQAALRMRVSRATFGRIIESAHRKIADALVNGKTLKIEGGTVQVDHERRCRCELCAQRCVHPGAACPHYNKEKFPCTSVFPSPKTKASKAR